MFKTIALFFAFLFSTSAKATTRWVVVGFDTFPDGPPIAGASYLCLQISDAIRASPEAEVVALCDKAASKAAVLEAIGTAASATKPGDTVVFLWLGHGATVSGKKPFFTPYDWDILSPGSEISIKDDLLPIFAIVPESAFAVVLADASHEASYVARDESGRSLGGAVLHGPTTEDWTDTGVFAVSATARGAFTELDNKSFGESILAAIIAEADTDADGEIESSEFLTAMFDASGEVAPRTGNWEGENFPVLNWRPPAPTKFELPPQVELPEPAWRRPVKFGALGLGAAGALAGGISYAVGYSACHRLQGGKYATTREYNQLADRCVSGVVGGQIGLAVAGATGAVATAMFVW